MVCKYRVAVVVDSSSCIPKEMQEQYGLHVVPHALIVDGKAYRDGVDMEPGRFYELLRTNQSVLSTASPRPIDFLDAYTEASKKGESVLCLTVSHTFASAYNSARVATEMAASSLPDTPITVVDTRTAAGAMGLITLEAARRAHEGASMEEVLQRVQEIIPKVNLIALLDTLYYLARGGRVPKVAAWAGTLLGMKPIAEMRLGEARLLEKPRSRSKAIERMFALMKEQVSTEPVHANVMHTDALKDAELFRDQVAQTFRCAELFISEFTPMMGAHLGPGLVGVAFY